VKTREMGVQYGDGGEQANPNNHNSWEFGAHPIVGTVGTDVNVRTYPLKYVNVTVSGYDCVALENSGCQIPLVSTRVFSKLSNETVCNVTLHGFGRGQSVQVPLANVFVCLSEVDCENMCKIPIMCAVTDYCSHDFDVILPAAVICNLQAKAVVSKELCIEPTVRKGQQCANSTTADRLSSGTKVGAAVGSKPRLSLTNRPPKLNLGCYVVHGAYAVATFCILCVALIVCVALMSVIANSDIMFAPVMLSCLSLSQRFEDGKIAPLQPESLQKRRQLLDEFADQVDDRPGRCDAVVRQVQATVGLVRRQMQPCRAPDVALVSRPLRPSNSLLVRLIVLVFATRTYPYGETKKDGEVRIACEYRYLNAVTVENAFLTPTISEVLRNIGKNI